MLIAELGINHLGNMDLARKMILLAKDNGATLAKLQFYLTENLSRSSNTLELLKKHQLSEENGKMLFDFGEAHGIEVFFSVFDVECVEWCERIGVKRYKIAARMDNPDVLGAIADTRKPVIASVSHRFPRPHNWNDYQD